MRRLLDLRLFSWAAVILWMAVIFFFSSLPGPQVPGVVPDYVSHFAEYAVLGWLVFRAVRVTKPKLPILHAAGWAISLSVLYALTDELHQLFVPARTLSGRDLLTDALGVLAAVALAGYVRVLLSRR